MKIDQSQLLLLEQCVTSLRYTVSWSSIAEVPVGIVTDVLPVINNKQQVQFLISNYRNLEYGQKMSSYLCDWYNTGSV